MRQVEIYTDGACSGNPGPGGWGAILRYGEHEREISGYESMTTNNRMELMGVISSLELLKEPCEVRLYTDSSYVVNAFAQHWIDNWIRNGWIKSDKNPVENQDLWKRLLGLTNTHDVRFIKVKGHSDNERNNRCDALARQQIKQNRVQQPQVDEEVS